MAAETADRQGRRVELGRILAHFGLEGWLKIESYTEPRERIFDYRPLYAGDEAIADFEGRPHGRGLLLRIAGRDRREAVDDLLGRSLWVARGQLAVTEPGEYYWSDLEGCRVVNPEGHDFGTVKRVMATGANDVLVVRGDRERLIPFLPGSVVREVDLDAGRIRVDWDPEF